MAVIDGEELHGAEIAKRLEMPRKHGHGSLYRALKRLEKSDLARLISHLEAAEIAERENRPRRRLYKRRPPQQQRSPGSQEGSE